MRKNATLGWELVRDGSKAFATAKCQLTQKQTEMKFSCLHKNISCRANKLNFRAFTWTRCLKSSFDPWPAPRLFSIFSNCLFLLFHRNFLLFFFVYLHCVSHFLLSNFFCSKHFNLLPTEELFHSCLVDVKLNKISFMRIKHQRIRLTWCYVWRRISTSFFSQIIHNSNDTNNSNPPQNMRETNISNLNLSFPLREK